MAFEVPEKFKGRSLYQWLEVEEFCDVAILKLAWRELALKYHPDRMPGCDQSARQFYLGSEAYRILKDVRLKQIYDRALRKSKKGKVVFQNRELVLQKKQSTHHFYSRKSMLDWDFYRFVEEGRSNFLHFLNNVDKVQARPKTISKEAIDPAEYEELIEEGRSNFKIFLGSLPRIEKDRW